MIQESEIDEIQEICDSVGIVTSKEIITNLLQLRQNHPFENVDFECQLESIKFRDKTEFDANELLFFKKSLVEQQQKNNKNKKGKKQNQSNMNSKPSTIGGGNNINSNNQKQVTPQKQERLTQNHLNSLERSQMDQKFEQRKSNNQNTSQQQQSQQNNNNQQQYPSFNPCNLPVPPIKNLKQNQSSKMETEEDIENYLTDKLTIRGNQGHNNNNEQVNMKEVQNIQFDNAFYNTLEKTDEALISKINYFEQLFISVIQKKDANFDGIYHDFSSITNEDVYLVGRIACEAEGKLSEGCVKFETKHISSHMLDLSKIAEYILFPGQIIAIKGYIQGELGKIKVSEIYVETVELQASEIENGQILSNIDDNEQFLIASGPYTLQDSIRYKPLQDLLEEAKQKKVDHLVLMGPFLDSQNQLIAEGELIVQNECISYESLFDIILDLVKQKIGKQAKIYIMPSPEDMISYHPLPQLSLKTILQDKKYSNNIQFLSNPASLMVSEDDNTRFTFMASKIGLEMISNTITKGPKYSNKIQSVYEQFLQQRTVLPLYPTQESQNLENALKYCGFNIEDFEETFPNLVVLPTPLIPQARQVNSTIFLNPGYLCKGEQGGSYSIVTYFKNNSLKNENKIRVDFYQV